LQEPCWFVLLLDTSPQSLWFVGSQDNSSTAWCLLGGMGMQWVETGSNARLVYSLETQQQEQLFPAFLSGPRAHRWRGRGSNGALPPGRRRQLGIRQTGERARMGADERQLRGGPRCAVRSEPHHPAHSFVPILRRGFGLKASKTCTSSISVWVAR